MGSIHPEEASLWSQICETGRRLWQRRLVAANDGNISVRLPDGRLLCTPSGVSKGFLGPDDWVITSSAGEKMAGRLQPSSELKMHVAVYSTRPDVRAVVHAHPPFATAFAVAGVAVPERVMPEIDVLLGKVALLPYCRPGTQELAEGVGSAAGNAHNVVLLSNHGATTWGNSLEEAWLRMESLDQCCQILLQARQLGEWREI
jgi:L-fuculose-phosphate aldolase